jgi:hypothetical protein
MPFPRLLSLTCVPEDLRRTRTISVVSISSPSTIARGGGIRAASCNTLRKGRFAGTLVTRWIRTAGLLRCTPRRAFLRGFVHGTRARARYRHRVRECVATRGSHQRNRQQCHGQRAARLRQYSVQLGHGLPSSVTRSPPSQSRRCSLTRPGSRWSARSSATGRSPSRVQRDG